MAFPGAVPEIEEREAALFNGYTWKEWLDLDREDRIEGIAHARVRRAIDAHVQDAVEGARPAASAYDGQTGSTD